MTLLRRLTSLTGESASAVGGGGGAGSAGFAGGGGQRPTAFGTYGSASGPRSGLGDLRSLAGNPYVDPGTASAYAEDASAGLMAVNLIRAHRDELMQASNGKLDHMVIDVVGSLFDQILSDTRVPPQNGPVRSHGCSCRCCGWRWSTRHFSPRASIRCAVSSTASPRWPALSTTSRTGPARNLWRACATWCRRSSTATSIRSTCMQRSSRNWSRSLLSRPRPLFRTKALSPFWRPRNPTCAPSSAI